MLIDNTMFNLTRPQNIIAIVLLSVAATALIITGSVFLGLIVPCNTTDKTCEESEKQRQNGIVMTVVGSVLAVVAILFGVYKFTPKTDRFIGSRRLGVSYEDPESVHQYIGGN